MNPNPNRSSSAMRAGGLSMALATALGVASPMAAFSKSAFVPPSPSGTVAVTNCNDSGSGSLRDAIAGAASGATVELQGLGCSVITLTGGQIEVPQDDLTVKYSGDGAQPTIGTNGSGRVFHHTGSGTFEIASLKVSDGKYVADQADGGCVFSSGSVYLVGATLSGCSAESSAPSGTGHAGRGGAVFAQGELRMLDSTLSGNVVKTTNTYVQVFGGGAYSASGFSFTDSVVTGNQTQPATNGLGFGGGGLAVGYSYVSGSTIDDNQANVGAGLALYGDLASVVNSTFSANNAGTAALSFNAHAAMLYNSTIAFNTASTATAGVTSHYALTLESSILANNQLFGGGSTQDIYAGTINGSHNLVVSGENLPPDTLNDDPMLLPLSDNGGFTRTHALSVGSPAVDRGSNVLNVADDQRGSGFARSVGAATDIGAFELQGSDDTIFVDGFDP